MILIDIFNPYPTAFFLTILNSKNIFKIITYGLVIDFFISYTNGMITLFLIIGYMLTKLIKNYYLFNIFIYLFYFLIFNNHLPLFEGLILQIIFIVLNKNHIINW